MDKNPQLALSIPNDNKNNSFFLLKLKRCLNNELSEFIKPSKLLSLSDIEGNFQTFRRLLIKNKIINNKYQWIYNDGHLVIVGDCFDRGEQVIECLWLIYSLEERAKKTGGHVHFILGNHEIMNMNGDWRYMHPKYAQETRVHFLHTALYDGNNELWRWLRTKNIIEKIGETLFVHGGISPQMLNLQVSIYDINNRARPYYTKANELYTDPFLQLIFNSETSPFWYRGYYRHEITEDQIDAILAHFKVTTIVTGHTRIDKISSFFNGKVINLNTNHAIGNSEALLVKNNRFYRVDKNGKRERIK